MPKHTAVLWHISLGGAASGHLPAFGLRAGVSGYHNEQE
jgi:hypothetical protein